MGKYRVNSSKIRISKGSWNFKKCSLLSEENGTRPIITVCSLAITILLQVLDIFPKVRDDYLDGSIKPASITRTDCFEYNEWNTYSTYDYLPSIVSHEVSVNKSFAILSYINNPKDHSIQVESVETDIIEVVPLENAVLRIKTALIDNVLKIYALNDGWGNAEKLNIDLYYSIDNTSDKHPLEDVAELSWNDYSSLDSGMIRQVAEFFLDSTRFNSLNSEQIWIYCYVNDEENRVFWLYYDPSTGEFNIYFEEPGDSDYSVQLFKVLDVDNPPNRLTYTSLNSTPIVEDKYQIETVIAPTKSCYVECKNVFEIDGKRHETDVMKITAYVPVFSDVSHEQFGENLSPMIEDMLAMEHPSAYQLRTMLDKYRYQPESILHESQ